MGEVARSGESECPSAFCWLRAGHGGGHEYPPMLGEYQEMVVEREVEIERLRGQVERLAEALQAIGEGRWAQLLSSKYRGAMKGTVLTSVPENSVLRVLARVALAAARVDEGVR